MSRHWKRHVVWLVAGFCWLTPLQPAQAQERASDEAKLYFSNGVELLQNDPPNYQDAYYQFRKAYEVSKSWKVLGNLGLCAFKLERDGEALDYYTEYLKRGGKEIDSGERSALEREMALITGNSAVVELTSTVPNVQVLDTRSGSSVPAQSYKFNGNKLTLRIRAGVHTLSITDSEGRRLSWEPALSPGETASHNFDFDAAPEKSAATAAASTGNRPGTFEEGPPQTVQRGGSVRIVGYITAGLGGATLIGAGVAGLLSDSKEQEAKDECPPPDQGGMCTLEEYNEKMNPAKSLARTANVLWVAGGIVTAAGIGMIIFGGPTDEPVQSAQAFQLQLSPVFTGSSGGLFASGRF